jgi:hypothetical protein
MTESEAYHINKIIMENSHIHMSVGYDREKNDHYISGWYVNYLGLPSTWPMTYDKATAINYLNTVKHNTDNDFFVWLDLPVILEELTNLT